MKQWLFLMLLIMGVSSCCTFDKCDIGDGNAARFRIVSAATGADLVFGPSAIYDKSQIKFFTLQGTDTITYYNNASEPRNNKNDSVFYVFFSDLRRDSVFVQLSKTEVDTLSLSLRIIETKCCTNFESAIPKSYNSQPLTADNGGVITIKK